MLRRLSRWERLLYGIILVLAVTSRFYMLEARAISHDESIHTKFSWNLYAGEGFQHNPMMHGPLLFEATALSYHLLGPNDFSSRVFTALAGIALVITPLLFRRWLGRTGAAVTATLLLISPSISYYSRYIRHDVLLMLTAVLLLWTIFEYLHSGRVRWLYWLAAFFSLMYATKEASYMYTAIYGVLLLIPFVLRVLQVPWQRSDLQRTFFGALLVAAMLLAIFSVAFLGAEMQQVSLDEMSHTHIATTSLPLWGRIAAVAALLTLGGAVLVVYYGVGEARMRGSRLFDVLMVVGTLTLPLGSAILIQLTTNADMQVVYDSVRTGNFAAVPRGTVVAIFAVTAAALAVSTAFGLWWHRKRWARVAIIHYTIFLVLYTTVFTWAFGALSGLIGGLAYWLTQHGVQRGNQPYYYYVFIGGLYEYLTLALSIGGGIGAVVYAVGGRSKPRAAFTTEDGLGMPELDLKCLFPLFLLGWTLLSWFAYSYAGEKMPWLVVHIVLPSVFLGGWGADKLLQGLPRTVFRERATWVLLLSLPMALAASAVLGRGLSSFRTELAAGASSAGFTLAQLRYLGQASGGLLGFLGFGIGVVWAVGHLGRRRCLLLGGLFATAVLGLLTIRTMAMVNFITYDLATEFLVYAHGTPDIKEALGRIREVSWRVTGSAHDVRVAYGEHGSWPFTWYMVAFPNNYFYSTSPDAALLRDCPVVIAGRREYTVVEEILGSEYVHFDYKYLWWPIQDYYGLTWARVRNALTDPDLRAALWDIVWRRDYAAYASLKQPYAPFTLQTWPYREDFRLYVRAELAQEIWDYATPWGVARYVEPAPTPPPDPHAIGDRRLPQVFEALLPGAAIRGVSPAGDGTFYVADTANHRIWHAGPEGVLGSFGTFGAAPGQFSEPWDIVIDADGNLYVADTWNHRIQKFDAQWVYVTSWGGLAQVTQINVPGTEGRFYGPRALTISADNELFVADTGNKRIQVFDLDGTYLREFGGGGTGAGQLDEPVGLDIDSRGLVAVADTWNQRIQLFDVGGRALLQWDMPQWNMANPEEKPFLAWGEEQLFVSDPLRRRVLAFDYQGAYQWALTGHAELPLAFPQGLMVSEGILYVTDAHSGELIGYDLP